MNGILWASLGVAVGILAPLIFRLWQRGVAGSTAAKDTPSAARARRPAEPPARPRITGMQPTPPKPPAGLNRRQTRKFHGVSVKPGLDACQAVQEIQGQRFLPEEAPAMPLAACDRDKCQCTYAHHGDRRDREDRRSAWGNFGGFSPSIPGGDRRTRSPGRRSGRH